MPPIRPGLGARIEHIADWELCGRTGTGFTVPPEAAIPQEGKPVSVAAAMMLGATFVWKPPTSPRCSTHSRGAPNWGESRHYVRRQMTGAPRRKSTAVVQPAVRGTGSTAIWRITLRT